MLLMIIHILLLQKIPKNPGAHPCTQDPSVELQKALYKHCPLHCPVQFLPNVPFSQPFKMRQIAWKAPDINVKKYKHEPNSINLYESYFSRIFFN